MSKKNILLSSKAIPSDQIGSWNVLLTNLVKKETSFFDKIISPYPSSVIERVNVPVETNNILTVFLSKFNSYYAKKTYWKKLKENITSTEIVNVIIFDDIKILQTINHYAKKARIRKQINIIYFIRGYRFDVPVDHRNNIYNCIDKLVIQTESSYKIQLQENHTIPCEVVLLPNGIDSKVFYQLQPKDKEELRHKLGFDNGKMYFLWVSQDRPKKGLSIVLKAWENIIQKHTDVELLILGTHNEVKGKQITWLGRKKNKQLARYYQSTDFYIFSSLCHEGHPLSLTEALKSGAKCLASDIDPISEVLHDGDLGYLVKNPHFVDSWVNAINDVLTNDINFNMNNTDLIKLYNDKEWIANFKEILN
ncbi:hypothetical protein GCM10011416_17370 [Polaribacter pacificus]|uniref:Glycosyl transferase family 1 domain-containing protein n=1 Tax=Polaribacter pacificus TaxID=1775173 RepID=A0A917I0C0_9FLAO|nr:glycosyltransferase family 4 protein [Polaribacter pacificus]GGG99550.1 hypothetical protein GCM10011416_17370 [Polaribacter pacificus]